MRKRIISGFMTLALAPVLASAQVPAAAPARAPAAAPAAPVAAAPAAPAGQPQAYMKNPFPHYNSAPQNRQEAIQRAQARVQVLQGMTDAQWNQWREEGKRRAANRGRNRAYQQQNLGMAPGKNVSPADREKARKNFAQ